MRTTDAPGEGTHLLVPLTDPGEWSACLSRVPHTWGHTWGHCHAMQASTPTEIQLYVYRAEQARVAFPIVIRRWRDSLDVATPFGFSGPAGTGSCPRWTEEWARFAATQGWVCGYVGLNPVLTEPCPLPDADVHSHNEVYLLRLERGEDHLLSAMSASRRRQLRRHAEDPPLPVRDRSRLLDFIVANSSEFFRRRSASDVYALSSETWSRLLSAPGISAAGVEVDGEVVAAFVFGSTRWAVDYLFGITAPGHEHLSAGLVWDAALAHLRRGVPVLNLGGGIRLGDGVAVFKQRFGPERVPLRSLRQVYLADRYTALCADAGVDPITSAGWFPPYRGVPRG